MATILGRLTNNGVEILNVDADPTLAPTPAPLGSLALQSDAPTVWVKACSGDTEWSPLTGSDHLIWNPGAVTQGAVYGNWTDLYNKIQQKGGGAVVVQLISGPSFNITAGGPYNLGAVIFQAPSSSAGNMYLRSGATIAPRQFPILGNGVNLYTTSGSATPYTPTAGNSEILVHRGAQILAASGVPGYLVAVPVGAAVTLWLDGSVSTAGGTTFDMQGGTLNVNFSGPNSLFFSDQLDGFGTVNFNIQDPTATWYTTQTGFTGTLNVNLLAAASAVGYSPTAPDTIDNVQDKLDDLVAGGVRAITDLDGDTSVTVEQPIGTDTDATVFTNNGAVRGTVNTNIILTPENYLEVDGDVLSRGIRWNTQTHALTNAWGDLSYGNGLFVAVSSSAAATAITSPDGVNWTSRTTAAGRQWNSLCYGNGLFVAVGSTGTGDRVMTSPDGINWALGVSAGDYQWWSVTYGNNTFVAVGIDNQVMTSPDGIAWTLQTPPVVSKSWSSVCYGNGLFVAVAYNGTAGQWAMTSSDGVSWTAQTTPADNTWRSVCYAKGLFVATGGSGTGNRVMTSPDGIAWTAQTSAADNNWMDVTFADGLFIAVSNDNYPDQVMTSPDGMTWALRQSSISRFWGSVVYGNGVLVAIGSTGMATNVMSSGRQIASVPPNNNILQGGLEVRGKLTVTGMIDPPGLTMSESSANPGVVAAGDGTCWVRDDTPNVLMFTDDAGTDWPLTGNGIAETSFSAANNQVVPADVTGFAFANASIRSFDAMVSVNIQATSPLYEAFHLMGIQKGTVWDLSVTSVGDDSNVDFTITNAGQVQYTSGNEAGFTSDTMKFRALVTTV